MAPHQRKNASKKKDEIKEHKETSKTPLPEKSAEKDDNPFRMPWTKVASRFFLSMLMIFAVYWTSKKDDLPVFASQKQKLQLTSAEVPCSPQYKNDISKFKGMDCSVTSKIWDISERVTLIRFETYCVPKHCGRLVTDIVVSPEEAAHLLRLSQKGLAFGGSDGGASILDLHSGALSQGNSFINIYEKLKTLSKNNIFTGEDFKVYKNVRTKIQQVISYNFGVPVNKLYLTHPTFFSEMTTRSAKTKHDEYWHVHVDKETYPSFHYTSLLYLTDYGVDFVGGRFIFVDEGRNVTVEPRIGRVSAFTSGAENPHYVERVSGGTRYALTVSFTCDPKFAIQDPSTKKLHLKLHS